MKLQLVKLHDTLADSFWFLPALMALLAAAAALACVAVDQAIGNAWLRDMGWVWSGGAEGARRLIYDRRFHHDGGVYCIFADRDRPGANVIAFRAASAA